MNLTLKREQVIEHLEGRGYRMIRMNTWEKNLPDLSIIHYHIWGCAIWKTRWVCHFGEKPRCRNPYVFQMGPEQYLRLVKIGANKLIGLDT